MTRSEITTHILKVMEEEFEITAPGLDDNLRDVYEFDSIDAIELLREIELLLKRELSQSEKKEAMEIRTVNDIVDYVQAMARAGAAAGGDQ